APAAVGILAGEEQVRAGFVPVERAEVFSSAGDADPFEAVKSVKLAFSAADRLRDVGIEPGEALFDIGVGDAPFAGVELMAVGPHEVILGDEGGAQAGAGHGVG